MEVVDIQEHACKHPRMENGEADEGVAGINGEIYSWRNSSRIIRVSRASGGKDRHSKVWTSKGLRDRRVRLSVPTAIQFYDLQDRLGYDQPSKAIEWLIKAAADAISDLPSLEASFPATPTQFSGEKRVSTAMEVDGEVNIRQKSTCSSPSDTSKGSSGLTLCQSKTRIKARDRADKEENQKVNHLSVSPSFTELLTGGVGRFAGDSAPLNSDGEQSFFPTSSTMDYFVPPAIQASGFPGQICCLSPTMATPSFSCSHENQGGMQHFSDHLIPNGGDYNLNFTISSGVTAGLNRGTLQSNSPSVLAHLQRFTSSVDGPNLPFYVGAAATPPAHPVQIHHQLCDTAQLQLWIESHSQKGKGKN